MFDNPPMISELNENEEKELIEGTPFKDKWELLDWFMIEYENDEKITKLYSFLMWISYLWLGVQIPYLFTQEFFEPVKYIFIFYYVYPFLPFGLIVFVIVFLCIGFIVNPVYDRKKRLSDRLEFVQKNKNDWLKNRSTDRKHTKEMVRYYKKWK